MNQLILSTYLSPVMSLTSCCSSCILNNNNALAAPHPRIFTSNPASLHSPKPARYRTQIVIVTRPLVIMSASTVGAGKTEEEVGAFKRTVITNPCGERLVGVLHEASTPTEDVVILCHGFRSSKESSTLSNLASALVETGLPIFRFDFSGNGESEGEFQYGNYSKEVEDLRSVVLHLKAQGRKPKALIGHSKGGNVVLLYASKYDDVHTVVNLSGRFNLQRGVKERLGEKGLQMIEQQGYVEVKDKNGNVDYTVTKTSLEERLNTDMKSAVASISKDCRIMTIHGTDDQIVDVEDANEFDRFISNHKLQILHGADHRYTEHKPILTTLVLDFLKGVS